MPDTETEEALITESETEETETEELKDFTISFRGIPWEAPGGPPRPRRRRAGHRPGTGRSPCRRPIPACGEAGAGGWNREAR